MLGALLSRLCRSYRCDCLHLYAHFLFDVQRLHGDDFPVIRITEGPLETEVQVTLPMVDHVIRIVSSPGNAFSMLVCMTAFAQSCFWGTH